MKRSEIIQGRLSNQGLSLQRHHTAEEATEWMGAVQGQDYSGAKLSIGMRCGLNDDDVEQAIIDRKIIRTWPMRGTLHFVSAKDIRWILSLGKSLAIRQHRSIYQRHGLDEKTFTKCFKVLESLLSKNESVTREEIAEALNRKKIETVDHRLSFILYRASVEGLVCFGARKGKQFTYTLLDKWSPGKNSLTPDESLYELSKRYFQSHGPASLKDFMWWSGLPKAEAARGIEMIKPLLSESTFAEVTFYYFKETDFSGKFSKTILLPGFDEYLLGYTDRSAVMDMTFHEILKQGNAMFLPTVLMKGRVEGFWKRTMKKEIVFIETKPLTSFTASQESTLKSAARNLGKFVGLKAELI